MVSIGSTGVEIVDMHMCKFPHMLCVSYEEWVIL